MSEGPDPDEASAPVPARARRCWDVRPVGLRPPVQPLHHPSGVPGWRIRILEAGPQHFIYRSCRERHRTRWR